MRGQEGRKERKKKKERKRKKKRKRKRKRRDLFYLPPPPKRGLERGEKLDPRSDARATETGAVEL